MRKTKPELMKEVLRWLPVLSEHYVSGQTVKGKLQGNNRMSFESSTGHKGFILHGTIVLLIEPEGTVKVNTGGWFTRTTIEAISQAINLYGLNLWVFYDLGRLVVQYDKSPGRYKMQMPKGYAGASEPATIKPHLIAN